MSIKCNGKWTDNVNCGGFPITSRYIPLQPVTTCNRKGSDKTHKQQYSVTAREGRGEGTEKRETRSSSPSIQYKTDLGVIHHQLCFQILFTTIHYWLKVIPCWLSIRRRTTWVGLLQQCLKFEVVYKGKWQVARYNDSQNCFFEAIAVHELVMLRSEQIWKCLVIGQHVSNTFLVRRTSSQMFLHGRGTLLCVAVRMR